jgi:plasmid stabilization system protein ParE
MAAFRLSTEAEAELDSIWLNIARQSGSIETASRVVDAISERFWMLAQFPQIGRKRDGDLRPGLCSFPVEGHVIVEMQMPMSLRFEAMPDDRNLRAVLYGPLVLAGGLGKHGLTDDLTIGPLGADLRKHPAEKIPGLTLGSKALTEWMRKGDATVDV